MKHGVPFLFVNQVGDNDELVFDGRSMCVDPKGRPIAVLPPFKEEIRTVDTETTGLAGGSGTYTFMVGIGRFEGDEFRLAQFFLRDPSEEAAQLAAIEKFLAPCQAVVSFNGKSFDLPLLNSRYLINGCPPPLAGAAHIDLLHLSRRLWRARLPSRTLGNLEAKILGLTRAQQDVPGWMIPDLFLDRLLFPCRYPGRVYYKCYCEYFNLKIRKEKEA